ncbi:unnamed protein product [Lupinus luteus]|uniref:Uncharacterized protein n=1 Tax=Lupinus luteus TaxID=3873 RepID=A0AAV1WV64_LUPLU
MTVMEEGLEVAPFLLFSKAIAAADGKELMRKLPKFIYDEEKALEDGASDIYSDAQVGMQTPSGIHDYRRCRDDGAEKKGEGSDKTSTLLPLDSSLEKTHNNMKKGRRKFLEKNKTRRYKGSKNIKVVGQLLSRGKNGEMERNLLFLGKDREGLPHGLTLSAHLGRPKTLKCSSNGGH